MVAKKKDDVKEDVVPGEAVPEEDAPDEAVASEAVEAGEDEEVEGEHLAFAMAPVVRLMKEELDNDKMIRRGVKVGMNKWLEKLARKVARKMNQSEYTVVEVDDLKTAIEPYEMIDDVELERQRIVATLEKIKMDCNSLIMDVSRKFITPETYSGKIEDDEEEGLSD